MMDFSPLELVKIKRILAEVTGDGESAKILEEQTPVKRRVCRRRRVGVC